VSSAVRITYVLPIHEQMADEARLGRLYEERVYDELDAAEDYVAWRRRLLSVVRVLKEFVIFCLTQFGLIILVVAYSLVGAYIFAQLEQPNEERACIVNAELYSLAETSMVYRMWEVVKAYQQLNDFQDATNALQGLLNEFKDTV